MKNSTHSSGEDLSGFTGVCRLDELTEQQGRRFIVENTEVAVFKLGGKVYTLNNICPHQHTALLYDGFIEHGCVVCPAHGWMFDLKTGKTPAGGRGVEAYETKVVEGRVFVKIVLKEMKW